MRQIELCIPPDLIAPGLSWHIPDDGFFQGNRFLLRPWLEYIREQLDPFARCETIVELFCGSGLIGGLCASGLTEKLIGFENHRPSIQAARRNASGNKGRTNYQYHVADLYSADFSLPDCDGFLINPPRGGLGRLTNSLSVAPATFMIYSSCSSQTLNRDIGILRKGGWECKSLALFDFFPRTPHVELVAGLQKMKS